MVLHEKDPTWAGRVAVRRHTCAITALSINTTLKQHPHIWSATNLPYDAYKLLAVPAPIGGVLVFCANSLHYHSQSGSCALGLNEFAVAPEGSAEYPRSKMSVELDCAHATWVANEVALISTKNGMLLFLNLVYEGRSVQRLELTKSKASVLTSCMCTIGENFFFLGSRLADSLLVQHTLGSASGRTSSLMVKAEREEGDIEADLSAPAAKRLKREPSEEEEGVSAEEMSLYYSTPTASDISQKKTFTFTVRDSLVNICPLRDFAYGLRSNADQSATGLGKQSNYELVACSGHGKNGSLSVLHQSIRPDLINKVALPGCSGIWTVYHKTDRDDSNEFDFGTSEDDEFHAYLIISLESRTMVLETGDTLGEVTENVEYYTEGNTIAAGNLFGRRFVVQVYQNGLRLLDGAKMLQELLITNSELENNSSEVANNLVIEAVIADPYMLLKMTDGSLQLVVGDVENTKLSIPQPQGFGITTDAITAFTLYQDKGPHQWLRRTCSEMNSDRSQWSSTSDQGYVYCIVCRISGRFEIYELPRMVCVYAVDNFNHGMSVLWDQKVLERRANSNAALKEGAEEDKAPGDALLRDAGLSLHVSQICFESWGEKFGRPFLLATLSDGTMLCYHAFSYDANESSDALEFRETATSLKDLSRLTHLRFARIPIDWVSGQEDGAKVLYETKFCSFKNVGSFPGVFVTGLRPTWLMVCRGRLRPHPQFCDGAILGFTPLHNVNCAHGFIYITAQGQLKICQLPSLLFYDNDWPVQKIPLRGTPHQITYHSDVNLYALIISTPVSRPTSQVLMGDGHPFDQQQENSIGEDGQRLVTSEDYEVRIIEPAQPGGNWEAKAAIKMHLTENALTVRIVSIKNITTDQTQTLLAIGTSYVQGEDVAAKGRIILVSVGKDPQDPGSWAREVYSKELKGSISAIASLQGHLLIAIGPKIILHSWNGSELNGAAFFDAPLYVVSLNIVKNFILFGDIHKSIYFLCWKEDGAQLTLLAKDFGSLDCYATEFLIDGSTLSLLVSDSRKNLQIFSYAPKSMESWKGQKLLSRAEFHLGAHVNKFHRLQMLPTPGSARSNRYAVLFGTLDGAIDYLAPLDELTFRRLHTLQRKLVDCVSHVAGVNPRAFRQFRCDGKAHRPGPDNIVDCELLSHYDMLPLDEQLEIARQIGTTRAHVLSNLDRKSVV